MPRSTTEIAIAMGKRMAQRRKELGLTQETVADLAGITYQQYNKAENGKTCLKSDSLQRISGALQTSADYLLSGKHVTDKYQDAVDILGKMTDRQLELAKTVLRCMVSFGDDCKD